MTAGRLATLLGSLAVLGIGAGALTWPRNATRTYGIPNDDADTHAYVRAVAARDLTMGLFVLWAAVADDRQAMKAGLAACTIAPLADLLLARDRNGMIPQLLIHGSGVVGVLAAWAILNAEDAA